MFKVFAKSVSLAILAGVPLFFAYGDNSKAILLYLGVAKPALLVVLVSAFLPCWNCWIKGVMVKSASKMFVLADSKKADFITRNEFFVASGSIIGSIERLLYLASGFFSQYSIVAGWLVLKAFSESASLKNRAALFVLKGSQMQTGGSDGNDRKVNQDEYAFVLYQINIIGNCLSLIIGVSHGYVLGQIMAVLHGK